MWKCSHPAVVQSTNSPGRKALPSWVLAVALDSAALRPGNSQRRRSGGRGEAWSCTFLDLTGDTHVTFILKFAGLREKSWVVERRCVFYLEACSRRPSCPSAPVLSRTLQALNLPPPPAPSGGCFGWDPTLVDTWWTHYINKLKNVSNLHCHLQSSESPPSVCDLRLSQTFHCPLADLSGACMSFTASPEIQHPLLAIEQNYRASGPQTCTAAIHF